MSGVKVGLTMPPRSAFDDFERETKARLKTASLNATQIAAGRAKAKVQGSMRSAGLGRLGNAIGNGGDLGKRGAVRSQGGGWSASGWVHVRSRSERTVGAIEAYTAGAEIAPRKGRWLWIPTDDIPARVGRRSVTPETYNRLGLETKIGPLVFVLTPSGRALLVVQGASLSASGRSRSAKSLRKNGGLRKGQVAAETIVAFVGIRRTSRAARVDVAAIMREAQASLPGLIDQQLGGR